MIYLLFYSFDLKFFLLLGDLNQPKWGHLKRLHEVLKSVETTLTMGSSRNIDYGNQMTVNFCFSF